MAELAAVAAALICLILTSASAQSPSTDDCTSQLAPALTCLDYVQNKAASPPKDCCDGLAQLTKSSPICLCSLARGKLSPVPINATRGLELPKVCKLKDADPSRCDALLGPSSPSPANSPAGGPAMESGGSAPSPSDSTSAFIPSLLLPISSLLLSALLLRH